MFEKQIKKMNMWDMALIKLAVAAFVLFVVDIWSGAMRWVNSVNPWYFLVVAIVLAAIPYFKTMKK